MVTSVEAIEEVVACLELPAGDRIETRDFIRTCGTALGGIMGLTCGSTMLTPDEEAERGVALV